MILLQTSNFQINFTAAHRKGISVEVEEVFRILQ